MRVVYHIPNDDLRAAETAAREAEAAGFNGIVALENAHGPFPPLSVAAMATDHIQNPKEGRWDEKRALITDGVLELFVTVGT
jgi:hypothetical protein